MVLFSNLQNLLAETNNSYFLGISGRRDNSRVVFSANIICDANKIWFYGLGWFSSCCPDLFTYLWYCWNVLEITHSTNYLCRLWSSSCMRFSHLRHTNYDGRRPQVQHFSRRIYICRSKPLHGRYTHFYIRSPTCWKQKIDKCVM